jgi:hypothetical protein
MSWAAATLAVWLHAMYPQLKPKKVVLKMGTLPG